MGGVAHMDSRTCSWLSVADADACRAKTLSSGCTQTSNGTIAIPATREPLRRYSRSSLRTISLTRLLVLAEELEVHVLERVPRLVDRQHIGAGRHESPGHGRRGDRWVGH